MKKGKIVIIFLILGLVLLLIFGIPVIINELYKAEDVKYVTVWGGSETLAYYGTVISAVGTIILGFIAWKQNERILMIEERSFLAANAGSFVLKCLVFKGINSTICNLEQHYEQILITDDARVNNRVYIEVQEKKDSKENGINYKSLSFECSVEHMNSFHHGALVLIKSFELMGSIENEKFYPLISASGIDKGFSSVAMSKEADMFNFSVITTEQEKYEIIKFINDYRCKLWVEIDLMLLTEKLVATELKCRAILSNPDFNSEEGMYTNFKTDDQNLPVSFWKGTSLMKKEDISIKTMDNN